MFGFWCYSATLNFHRNLSGSLKVGRIQDPNFSSCIFEIFFRLDPTDFEKRLQKQSPIKDMSDPLSPTLLDCPSAEVSDEAMAM